MQDTLSTTEEGPTEEKVEIPIAKTKRDWWLRVHQPKMTNIAEASTGGACMIKGKASTDSDNEESVAMGKLEARH